MKRLPLGPLVYEYSRHIEPRLRIEPGETIVVESEDAFSGQIRTDADRRDKTKMPLSNPQTGPIWIEGAEPGDALAVKIEAIRPLSANVRRAPAKPGNSSSGSARLSARHARLSDSRRPDSLERQAARSPTQPMLGCIGTAPTWERPARCRPARMAATWISSKSARAAPCICRSFVPGGYLYLGDAHAAMGHGELSASGLEMPAESEITVRAAQEQAVGLAADRVGRRKS